MSDNLPFDIQVEIIKKLPVKPLIQFRSVSKTWKSLIDSSDFVDGYSGQHTQIQRLLIVYEDPGDINQEFVSIADDNTFPHHKIPLTTPLLVNMLMCWSIIGSSHGLFCLYGLYPNNCGCSTSETWMAVVWNPSIRKTVPVVVPNAKIGTIIGFGVCRATTDPKIVKITQFNRSSGDIESISSIPWQVEVFTLSKRVWRSSYSTNLPRKSIQFHWLKVVVDGFLYWLATDRIAMDGGFRDFNLVISFDLTSEEFREVNLPDSLAHQSRYNLSMSKLRESLVVLEGGIEDDNVAFSVWMMEDGVLSSFKKLFSFNVNTPDDASVRGFRKSGEPITEILEYDLGVYKLVVYDPYSKDFSDLGIDGVCSLYVYPYMETLLLLDQPSLIVYNESENIEFPDDLVS